MVMLCEIVIAKKTTVLTSSQACQLLRDQTPCPPTGQHAVWAKQFVSPELGVFNVDAIVPTHLVQFTTTPPNKCCEHIKAILVFLLGCLILLVMGPLQWWSVYACIWMGRAATRDGGCPWDLLEIGKDDEACVA
eukprot:TRINITY_DN68033_c7_g1_i3.p1 TRINITY_DN68033_c7_g1~~TRINITY_DN68033_c7_g1_i3.p1  ORF type:complete len:134 (-),score=15.71 TRINITY_DN68033_c7_g1_i3:182-583(-)